VNRTRFDRRNFLKTSAAAAAAVSLPTIIPSGVLGGDGSPGANERVNVGVIGCGGRARAVFKESADVKSLRVAAVCDCMFPRAEQYAKLLSGGAKWGLYRDFRNMIDQEKLDAVMVETTTHARAWIAILAMQAGMDAYIEKPMCLTIAEGRAMVDAARKFGRVTQVGTQQRSMPINNWASDLVKNGALGKIHTVIAPNFVGPDLCPDLPAEKMPDGGADDWWDVWTNQAVYRPYNVQIHRGWDRWWDYDGGGRCFGVTGWGTHSYDQVNRALGTDDTGPLEVLLEEPAAVRDARRKAPELRQSGLVGDEDTGTEYHHMTNLAGPRAKVAMTFAGGTKLKLHLDGDRGPGLGAIFHGDEGKLEINRNKIASNPKSIVESADNPGKITRPETAYHVENWLDCVKSRERCTADIEIGQRSSTLCYLVNIARDVGRVGEPLKWDPQAERFTNCDEGNKLLDRPRRKGYELPDLG